MRSIIVAAAILLFARCTLVGRDLDFAIVDSIKVGDSQAQIRAKLGEPFAKYRVPGGAEVWMYQAPAIDSDWVDDGKLSLRFINGILEKHEKPVHVRVVDPPAKIDFQYPMTFPIWIFVIYAIARLLQAPELVPADSAGKRGVRWVMFLSVVAIIAILAICAMHTETWIKMNQ